MTQREIKKKKKEFISVILIMKEVKFWADEKMILKR